MSNEAGNVRCCDQMHDAKQNKKHSTTAKYSGVSRCRHKQLQLLGPKRYLPSHCFRNATRLMRYGRKAARISGPSEPEAPRMAIFGKGIVGTPDESKQNRRQCTAVER